MYATALLQTNIIFILKQASKKYVLYCRYNFKLYIMFILIYTILLAETKRIPLTSYLQLYITYIYIYYNLFITHIKLKIIQAEVDRYFLFY